ncbi:hypothetical protein FHW79_005371 [Azospirillum sp. OGB3]|uniref:hypothetical protein n=1 Tax=Azospirillum sp. OGB3 TaxID=2587012 RepID=UPI00160651AA|nr:hypothetical protein [Azospirillum sp. OGB3]MBB3267706.1 hypothetical protein [Azospirillum sp. OGB3]
MTVNKKPDPLGGGYWHSLTDGQLRFLGALPVDYRPLRAVLDQVEANAAKIGGQVNWEKLAIIEALEVDFTRRDDVYVRRGRQWQSLWDRYGLSVTNSETFINDLAAELGPLLAEVGRSHPTSK